MRISHTPPFLSPQVLPLLALLSPSSMLRNFLPFRSTAPFGRRTRGHWYRMRKSSASRISPEMFSPSPELRKAHRPGRFLLVTKSPIPSPLKSSPISNPVSVDRQGRRVQQEAQGRQVQLVRLVPQALRAPLGQRVQQELLEQAQLGQQVLQAQVRRAPQVRPALAVQRVQPDQLD